jgi:hypothetical protein
MEAERRMGEILRKTERNVGAKAGKTGIKTLPLLDDKPTLTDLGLTKRESAEAQMLSESNTIVDLPHGEWMDWMEKNLEFSDRKAEQYMKAFDRKDELKIEATSILKSGWWKLIEHIDGKLVTFTNLKSIYDSLKNETVSFLREVYQSLIVRLFVHFNAIMYFK